MNNRLDQYVGDGHEVSGSPSENEYTRRILEAISSGQRVTQRSLSRDLDVALGLANLLMRRLVAKGYVRMAGVRTRHIRYLMTSAGWDALAHATRLSLDNTVRLYTETREQLRACLLEVAARCQPDAFGERRIVFYGAGDVAEIAYVSLQGTTLTLVGVVDDDRSGLFFGLPIVRSDLLTSSALAGHSYTHLIVTSIRHADAIRTRLQGRAIPAEKVSYI